MPIFSHIITQSELPCGARLVFVAADDLPLSAVSVWFRAGSRFDPAGQEGLSHFFEHLLMARTDRFLDRKERLRSIESHSIASNAFTNYEAAYYHHIQPVSETLFSLDLLLDGLVSSRFDEEDVARERAVILDEASRNHDDPGQYLWQLSSRGLWPDSPFARDFFGNRTSLGAIALGDIRSFYAAHYGVSQAVFVVIGPRALMAAVRERLEQLPASSRRPLITPASALERPLGVVKDERQTLQQVTIGLNYQAPPIGDFDGTIVFDLIRSYLASGWASKLVEKTRIERDLTYWVNGVSEHFSDRGYLRFECSSDQERVPETLDIMTGEIEKLSREAVTEEALTLHKNMARATLLRYALDPGNLLWFYGWPAVLGGKVLPINEYANRLQAVTPDDIRQVAGEWLVPEKRSVALIGDVARIDL